MIKYLLPTVALLAYATPSLAIDANIIRQLNRLSPKERIEQRCDIEAMEQISKGKGGYNADRVVSYTFGAPKVGANSVKADGAAFRSKGNWYRLQYDCTINTKTLSVTSFQFQIGEKVPQEDWARYYLYS